MTVDVRVIAATNKNLEEEIRTGRFREDLFFRLNVIPFHVPPLRERREDVPLLARHFMAEISAEYGKRPKELAPEALELLARAALAGQRARAAQHHRAAGDHDAGRPHRGAPPAGAAARRRRPPRPARRGRGAGAGDFPSLAAAREDFEKRYIWKKYQECGGNMSRTAEALAGRALEPLPEDEGLRPAAREGRPRGRRD